jgi:hypothetical protein
LKKALRRSPRALLPAQLPNLAGQDDILLVEIFARLRSSCVHLLFVSIGNVRLEDLPPAGIICDRHSESFREQAAATTLLSLRATKFEFEKRFWIICAIYFLGFSLSNFITHRSSSRSDT